DKSEDVLKRLKRFWIAKNAQQPFGIQRTAYAFRNPRGQSAADLIEKVGLNAAKVGGAEVCDHDPCYVVAHDGCASRDVRRLLELLLTKVAEKTGVDLDVHLDVW